MKKAFILFALVAILLAGLQNCKPEPTDEPTPNDADSLYTSIKHTIVIPNEFPQIEDPYKDSLTEDGIELGRRLFYDKNLSSTKQLACASCHKQEFAFSDGGVALSTNVFGLTHRNAPALQNLAWDRKFFWDGRVNTLADQAKDAYMNEQGMSPTDAIAYLESDSTYARLFRKAFGRPGKIVEDNIYKAVQQFLMTLISADSKFDKSFRGQATLNDSELRGFQVFRSETGDCIHCHIGQNGLLLTDLLFRNNGLDSAVSENDFVDKGVGGFTGNSFENGKFKDPTVRNIALTGPYMHDGRFATIEEVVNFYNEGHKMSPTIDVIILKPQHANGGLHLPDDDTQALIDFLHALTDTTFTNNPKFKNPF